VSCLGAPFFADQENIKLATLRLVELPPPEASDLAIDAVPRNPPIRVM